MRKLLTIFGFWAAVAQTKEAEALEFDLSGKNAEDEYVKALWHIRAAMRKCRAAGSKLKLTISQSSH